MKHIIFCSIAVVSLIVGCQSDKIATPTDKPITVAEPGVEDSAGGTGRAAARDRFSDVYGVAVDNAGNVYVADSGNSAIRKVTPQGMVTTLAGSAGEGSVDGTGSTARFRLPCGVALDRMGNLYVADYFNHTIRKVMPMGTNWVVTTLAGNASIVDTNGSPVGGCADGTGSAARFNQPMGMAIDSAGNLYVTDGNSDGNSAIRKVTPLGVVTTLVGNDAAQLGSMGVAVDSAGKLYLADCRNYAIRKVTPVGTNWVVTTLAGSVGEAGSADGTGRAARFGFEAQMAFCPTGPYGVAVDRAGNVYVADTRNGIRKVTPMGVVTTLAMCNAAEHVCPSAVAVDRAGNLYVADVHNNAILKVTPVGTNWVVTTLAGSSR